MTENNQKPEDELNLRLVFASLLRQKTWVLRGGIIGLSLAGIYLLVKKPIYQGNFQIVLNKSSSTGGAAAILAQNPGLASLAGLGGFSSNDSISTEVEILNSPSVMLPVFNAVKASKPTNVAKNMRFDEWAKKSVTVKEAKNTSVLNVEFRDTDKSLVLPTTKLLSEVYQRYSYRGRSRELDNVMVKCLAKH